MVGRRDGPSRGTTTRNFFANRIGGETYPIYGFDLASSPQCCLRCERRLTRCSSRRQRRAEAPHIELASQFANLEPRPDVRARTGVTADATHLVSPDSRADEHLPCFGDSAGKRAKRPAKRGSRASRRSAWRGPATDAEMCTSRALGGQSASAPTGASGHKSGSRRRRRHPIARVAEHLCGPRPSGACSGSSWRRPSKRSERCARDCSLRS